MVGDQLGEMLQQVSWAADAVLGEQAIVLEVADGSVEPGPRWRPSPRWQDRR
jgi:hypothetical protein